MSARSERSFKVLHVIGGVGPGGAETMMYRLILAAPHVLHEVICLGGRDWYSRGLEERGIRVTYLQMTNMISAIWGVFTLTRRARRSGADVIQGWMYRSNVLAAIAAWGSGIPVVWGIHNSSLEPIGLAGRIWVYVSGILAGVLPSFIINCSRRSADLHARLGFSRAVSQVIPNGYDPSVFSPESDAAKRIRHSLGVGEGEFLVGSIARWHVQKDIPTLLRAVRGAHEQGVPIRCLLIGHRLDRGNPDLLKLIAAERCEDIAIALGRRHDVADLARALDVHILASCGGEAFPNSVAETMLCGTPNIVTDVGDSGFMVGETGWVVVARQPEAITQAILSAFEERTRVPRRWRCLQEASRSRIAEHFSLRRMAEAYERVWRSVAKNRGALQVQ